MKTATDIKALIFAERKKKIMPGKFVVFKHIEITVHSRFHRRLGSTALGGLNSVRNAHSHIIPFRLVSPACCLLTRASFRYDQKLEQWENFPTRSDDG